MESSTSTSPAPLKANLVGMESYQTCHVDMNEFTFLFETKNAKQELETTTITSEIFQTTASGGRKSLRRKNWRARVYPSGAVARPDKDDIVASASLALMYDASTARRGDPPDVLVSPTYDIAASNGAKLYTAEKVVSFNYHRDANSSQNADVLPPYK